MPINFTKNFARVTNSRGSVRRRQCNTLCTSGFVDDVTFAHNGLYDAWLMERIASHSPGTEPGEKS